MTLLCFAIAITPIASCTPALGVKILKNNGCASVLDVKHCFEHYVAKAMEY